MSANSSEPNSPAVTGRRMSRHQGKLYSANDNGSPTPTHAQQQVTADAAPPRDEMLLALEDQLGREEAHELQELFKLVDKDGGGNISQNEFIELLHTMSVRPSAAEMDLMYGELDADNDGVIEYSEFLKFMCSPGVQSANGSKLLQSWQHVEAIQYERGEAHPQSAGRTGRYGQIHVQELAHAFRTYLPDKVRSDREVNDLLHAFALQADKRTGFVDYKRFTAEHVNPATMPPVDPETGAYVFPQPSKAERRRKYNADRANQALVSSTLATSAAASAAAATAVEAAEDSTVESAASAATGDSTDAAPRSTKTSARVTHEFDATLTGGPSDATADALASLAAGSSMRSAEREAAVAAELDTLVKELPPPAAEENAAPVDPAAAGTAATPAPASVGSEAKRVKSGKISRKATLDRAATPASGKASASASKAVSRQPSAAGKQK